MATPPSSRGMSPNPELSQSAFHLSGRFHSISGGKGTPCSSTPPSLADELAAASLSHSATSLPCRDGRPMDPCKPPLLRQEPVRELEKSGLEVTNHREGSAEAGPMTLNELSVYMKEQEQQRPSREREEAAIMEELVKLTEVKQRDSAGRSGFDSPFYRTTETLTGTREKPPSASAHGGPPRDGHAVSTSTPDARPGRRAMGSRAGSQEQAWSFQPLFTPIEQSGALRRSPSTDDEAVRYGPAHSPGPGRPPALPYEALFDLTLPRAAFAFVRRRTSEALDRAEAEGRAGGVRRSATCPSPLEVLDQLVQQGNAAHDRVLQRLSLPSKSADWTHFGGSVPLEELHTLRSQLLLLHNQLLFERYKREQHAVRNRRLLRRIISTTALEEQNNAMKDQLNLQCVDIVSLRESLQVEQLRYRQQREEREAEVTRLHAQLRQLQRDHHDYYTKNQELESKLQECQKRMKEMEAELQAANNKVCHTGHQLKQLTAKLSSSEKSEQQLGFLSRQLLLLGEAHKLCLQELQQAGPDTTKEVEMLHVTLTKEVEQLKQSLLLQVQKLEAAQQRVTELEAQLSKKEHLIAEQKLFLEDVKCQAKEELQASESRYQAQRAVTQALHTELLQLYSRLETEACTATATTSPAGGATEHCHHTETCVMVMDGLAKPASKDHGRRSLHGNGSLFPLGRAEADRPDPETKSVNGSRDTPPPVLVEPPPPRPHVPLGPPGPPAPAAVPLTVGSYPSAKSFLGMRARELFRNKSESQCDEGDVLRPQLASLSQGLKTELCVEVPVKTAPGPGSAPSVGAKQAVRDGPQRGGNQGGAWFRGAAAPPKQQQLRIMDYNETHLEHS